MTADLGAIMALLRGMHLAAALSLLGTAGFLAWMLPAAAVQPAPLLRRLRRLWWGSGLTALATGAAWFVLQAGTIADADSPLEWLDALPAVAVHTRYGNMLMARFGLLAVATALAWWRARIALSPGGGGSVLWPGETGWPATGVADRDSATPGLGLRCPMQTANRRHDQSLASDTSIASLRPGASVAVLPAVALAAVAVGLQGWIGHAGATGGAAGDGLVLSEACHLLAAGLWLGSLMPLWLSVRGLPADQAALVCERFSPIALACVAVLAGSGLAQSLWLIGGVVGLVATTYGHIALLKITLFLLALVLAAINRLWLTDRMAAGAAGARGHLLLSVGLETLLGLGIVGAAAFMASTTPAVHATPVWPFSWQFSLITMDEDPDFRQEIVVSLMAIGGAMVMLLGAVLWRRLRLLALAVLVFAVVLRGPSLGLLTVEAYPTSFQTSPTGFSAASITRGEALFAPDCAVCHGPAGAGDGPLAAGLRIKPADLTMPHVLTHSDGDMFWWLSHGVDNPEGGLAMPGFAEQLPAADRWALIDYVRAHNAGLALQRNPAAGTVIAAPAFAVRCAGLAATRTADLHGHVVHVVTGDGAAAVAPQRGITTIALNLREGAEPAAGTCVAADSAAWAAYAVLAGSSPDRLAGTEFLVDPNGWLRAAGAWRQQDGLVAAIRGIIAHPVEQPNGGQHEHHH